MNKVQAHGLDRLKHRIERLTRLLELEAPAFIVINEIQMIVKAAKLYSPEAWYKSLRHFEMRSLKVQSGFCSQEGCDERRDHEAKELSDMCPHHIAEFDKQVDEVMDADFDDNNDDEELSS